MNDVDSWHDLEGCFTFQGWMSVCAVGGVIAGASTVLVKLILGI